MNLQIPVDIDKHPQRVYMEAIRILQIASVVSKHPRTSHVHPQTIIMGVDKILSELSEDYQQYPIPSARI